MSHTLFTSTCRDLELDHAGRSAMKSRNRIDEQMSQSTILPPLSSLGLAFDRQVIDMSTPHTAKLASSGITALYRPSTDVQASREASVLTAGGTSRLDSPKQASFALSALAEKVKHNEPQLTSAYTHESPRSAPLPMVPRHHPYADHRDRSSLSSANGSPWSPSAISRMRLSTSPGYPSVGHPSGLDGGGVAAGRPLDQMMTSTNPMTSTTPYTRLTGKVNTPSACAACKRAHLGCDSSRPCRRCQMIGKPELCLSVVAKKRGRPKLPKGAIPGKSSDERDQRSPSTGRARKPSISLGWTPNPPYSRMSPEPYMPTGRNEWAGRGFSNDLAPGQRHQLPALERSEMTIPTLIERRTGKRAQDMEVDTSGVDKHQWLQTQHGTLPSRSIAPPRMQRAASSGATLCTLFASTSLQIVRCSDTTFESTGFHPEQIEGQPFMRFVTAEDIASIEQLRSALLGALRHANVTLGDDQMSALTRKHPSDLQTPARETQYVDRNISLILANGNYQPFNVRMHVGGALGTDLRSMTGIGSAYVVISLLRLEKPQDSTTRGTERSGPDSVRSSLDTGSRSSFTSSSGYSLPPFSAISAGINDERGSAWPATPMLTRPISSSGSSSPPSLTGILSASFTNVDQYWSGNGKQRRSSSMVTLPLPIGLHGSMRSPIDIVGKSNPIHNSGDGASTSPPGASPQSPSSYTLEHVIGSINGSSKRSKRSSGEHLADAGLLHPDTAKSSIGGWSPVMGP